MRREDPGVRRSNLLHASVLILTSWGGVLLGKSSTLGHEMWPPAILHSVRLQLSVRELIFFRLSIRKLSRTLSQS